MYIADVISIAEKGGKFGNRREHLIPNLIKHFKLETGIEIGVDLAEFSCQILKNTPESFFLTCVDPYLVNHDGKYHEKKSEERWKQADSNLNIYREMDRCELIRETSEGFAMAVDPEDYDFLYDFCYIDGDHSYKSAKQDIELWWERSKYFISGHDYRTFANKGVKKAVEEFAKKVNKPIHKLSGRGSGFIICK